MKRRPRLKSAWQGLPANLRGDARDAEDAGDFLDALFGEARRTLHFVWPAQLTVLHGAEIVIRYQINLSPSDGCNERRFISQRFVVVRMPGMRES